MRLRVTRKTLPIAFVSLFFFLASIVGCAGKSVCLCFVKKLPKIRVTSATLISLDKLEKSFL